MWHCVISGGVIACHSARNCFKYYDLWYAVRFAWCYWEKISKFNVFHFLPASAISVSDNLSSPYGDSRWGRGKWLEVTVLTPEWYLWRGIFLWYTYDNLYAQSIMILLFLLLRRQLWCWRAAPLVTSRDTGFVTRYLATTDHSCLNAHHI